MLEASGTLLGLEMSSMCCKGKGAAWRPGRGVGVKRGRLSRPAQVHSPSPKDTVALLLALVTAASDAGPV